MSSYLLAKVTRFICLVRWTDVEGVNAILLKEKSLTEYVVVTLVRKTYICKNASRFTTFSHAVHDYKYTPLCYEEI